MEVTNRFAERRWGATAISIYKMEYEIIGDCMKLSYTLVPMINNDCSPKEGGY